MMKTPIIPNRYKRSTPLTIQLKPQSQWPKPLGQRPVHDLLDGIDTPDLLPAKLFRGPDLFNSRRTQTRFGSLTSESDSLDSLIDEYLKPEDMDDCSCEAENTVHIMPTAIGDTEVMLNQNEVNYLNQWSTETYDNSGLDCLSVYQSNQEIYLNTVDQMKRLSMDQLNTWDELMVFDEIQNPSAPPVVNSANSQPMATMAAMGAELMSSQPYLEQPVELKFDPIQVEVQPISSLTLSSPLSDFLWPSISDLIVEPINSYPETHLIETVAHNSNVSTNFEPHMINGMNDLNRQSSVSITNSAPLVNIAADNPVYEPSGSMVPPYQSMSSPRKGQKRQHSNDKKKKKPMTGKEKQRNLEDCARELGRHRSHLVSVVHDLESKVFHLKKMLFQFGFNSEQLNHYYSNISDERLEQ